MMNLKQVKELKKILIFTNTTYKKYNNNFLVIYKYNNYVFIMGIKRVIKNIVKKYPFISRAIRLCRDVADNIIIIGGYGNNYEYINFINNELKDLNDSEKLFVELED